MIQINDLTLRRGAKVILDGANVVIQPGEKVGIVGANGAGKSSLFGLLLDSWQEDGGNVSWPPNWRMASVAQDSPDSALSAAEFVLHGDSALQEAVVELEAAYQSNDGIAIAHAQEAYEMANGYTARPRAEALLLGLGFKHHELAQHVNAFSGGWRMRLSLAQALMCPSDLLLLDEPTNHLDLDAMLWLEQWLKRYAGTLLVISHDREFLDAVCKVTVHIDNQKLIRYTGNYSQFESMRAEQLEQQQAAYGKQQENIAKLTRFIDRFKAKASKAKQAQSRVKALDKMQKLAPVWLAHALQFEFLEPDKVPQQPVLLADAECGYSGTTILRHVQHAVLAGSRIGVLGANGQGKSTLIKSITGTLPLLSGELRTGKDTKIGYFAQHELDVLREDENPLQHFMRLARDTGVQTREQELRNWLGRFQFRDTMVQQAVGNFSGGEKSRLVMAMLVWQRPNLLLLDEPTNHLDMATREALTMALAQYEGAVLLVSHDRALLRAVCDDYWLVADGKVATFDGDLDDYERYVLERRRSDAARERNAPSGTHAEPVQTKEAIALNVPAATITPLIIVRKTKDEKRREAEARQAGATKLKPLKDAITKLDGQLAGLNPKLKALEAELADPASYDSLPPQTLKDKLRESGLLRDKVEAIEAEWLEKTEALETQLQLLEAA